MSKESTNTDAIEGNRCPNNCEAGEGCRNQCGDVAYLWDMKSPIVHRGGRHVKNMAYIAGQITGLTEAEYMANFEKAEAYVKLTLGCDVVNPTKLPHKHGQTWNEFMAEDIAQLLQCSTIYLMHNWAHSRGARLERAIALELGMYVVYGYKHELDYKPIKEEV